MEQKREYQFLKTLNNLLSVGYQLEEALDILALMEPSICDKIKSQLATGMALSESLAGMKFSVVVVELIKIGEDTNRLTAALELLIAQFQFKFQLGKLTQKLLFYPLFLLMTTILCLEFLRINLYPQILSLTTSFHLSMNPFLVKLAFHGFKFILAGVMGVIVSIKRFPRLLNLSKVGRCYHSLWLNQQLLLYLKSGYRLNEVFNKVEHMNPKRLKVNELEQVLLLEGKVSRFSSLDPLYVKIFNIGLNSNHLCQSLNDFASFYYEHLVSRLEKALQIIQVGLITLVAANIMLVYYLMMVPIFKISSQI